MDRLKEDIMGLYTNEAYCSAASWKLFSDLFFGPKQVVEVWRALGSQGLLPPGGKPLTFVSPTSHLPTHELAIWKETANREGQTNFVVGDLREVSYRHYRDKFASSSSDTRSFALLRCDAEALPIQKGNIDVLWDRKGWLWHLASKKEGADLHRLWNSLDRYWDHLRLGGIVVIDALEGFSEYSRKLRDDPQWVAALLEHVSTGKQVLPNQMYPEAPNQYEESTVELLNHHYPNFWNTYARSFNILDLGEGAMRVRVLQRK